ncbi:YrrS family protein [Alkalihalobacillus sp. LMS39]|uniref:YrrS family protein n=1 Tax=Alkalihalobacillus sp. LMS39 TaxID=2924032 RepID=UPI001FB1EB78|nr:YrrS family protein [Alkalihalobacillus sp. LMS39]UOE95585.1 YrrS family protein [Alkalihalobacillus sp. LMS39]
MEFQTRSLQRQKLKRKNRILNVSITILLLLIIVFSYQLFFKGERNQDVIADYEESEGGGNETENQVQDDRNDQDLTVDEEASEDEDNEETEERTDEDWEPIGTAQQDNGQFEADFSKGSVNWNEMTQALQYATGLSDDEMEIWWLGNGGNLQSAVGIVSTFENKNTPYEVRLEWVTNEGWQPVSVEQLSSNPRQ